METKHDHGFSALNFRPNRTGYFKGLCHAEVFIRLERFCSYLLTHFELLRRRQNDGLLRRPLSCARETTV